LLSSHLRSHFVDYSRPLFVPCRDILPATVHNTYAGDVRHFPFMQPTPRIAYRPGGGELYPSLMMHPSVLCRT